MYLSRIKKVKVKKKKKRLGRGYGSGKGGHTTDRGTKGQKARSKVPQGFEGGQVPLYKKLPTIGGFTNPTSKKIVAVSLFKLNVFRSGTEVTPGKLVEKRIIKKIPKDGVKVLDKGRFTKKISVKGLLLSKSAREKIEKAGGKVVS